MIAARPVVTPASGAGGQRADPIIDRLGSCVVDHRRRQRRHPLGRLQRSRAPRDQRALRRSRRQELRGTVARSMSPATPSSRPTCARVVTGLERRFGRRVDRLAVEPSSSEGPAGGAGSSGRTSTASGKDGADGSRSSTTCASGAVTSPAGSGGAGAAMPLRRRASTDRLTGELRRRRQRGVLLRLRARWRDTASHPGRRVAAAVSHRDRADVLTDRCRSLRARGRLTSGRFARASR